MIVQAADAGGATGGCISNVTRWTTYGLTGPTSQEIRAVNDHYSSSGSGGGDGGGEPPVGPIITDEVEKIK